MKVYFINLNKKRNSTLRPATSSCAGLDVVFKDGCSITNPVITVERAKMGMWNYCIIPDFNRYYYINDVTISGPVAVYSCECDVLASYKYDIRGTNQFVERCNAQYNELLIDNIYPAESAPDIVNTIFPGDGRHHVDYHNATYIISTVCQNWTNVGAACYYAMSWSGLQSVIDFLFNRPDEWLSVEEISGGLTKALVNPMQYITSCKMLPVSFSDFKSECVGDDLQKPEHTIFKFGWWSAGQISDCFVVGGTDLRFTKEYIADIPEHPQTDICAYLSRKPFTFRTLYIPHYGTISIDPDEWGAPASFEQLKITHEIDIVSGAGVVRLYARGIGMDDNMFSVLDTSPAVDIQLAQLALSAKGYATSSIIDLANTGVQSVFKGSFVGNLVEGLTSTLSSANEMYTSAVTIRGANGSPLKNNDTPILHSRFYRITQPAPEIHGRPLNSMLEIGADGPGTFYKCATVSLQIAGAYSGEMETLKRYMLDGFYYE